jgi:deazaflavin-dependent oxidoreductase (nitroreductase family)
VPFVDQLQAGFLKLHQTAYERSGGLIGHRMISVPTLLLYTTGRRSGARRTNALVYAPDGADYLVVASNGGQDKPPGWLFNVQANPEVDARVGRSQWRGRARVIDASDPDYARVWKIVNDRNHGRYDAYQQKTARKIPVVAVTPA